jgi:hypothetical protein
MSRKEEHRIDDLIGCCEKIIRYTSGLTKEQLAEQEMVLDAVLSQGSFFSRKVLAMASTSSRRVRLRWDCW